jgi:hypothetical protein
MSKKVEVWLSEASEPLVHEAISTYTKGPLYCVYCEDGNVVKYPVEKIFRIVEGYGTHGGNTIKNER